LQRLGRPNNGALHGVSETVAHATKGSIFDNAALNFPPEHRAKAELVDEIGRRMAADTLTLAAAAARIGIAQSDLSNILRGKFRGHSVDRLTAMLGKLGYGVDIVLRTPAAGETVRTVHVIT